MNKINNPSLLLCNNYNGSVYLKVFKKNRIFFKNIFIYGSKVKVDYPYCNNIYIFNQKKYDLEIKRKIKKLNVKNIICCPAEKEIYSKSLLKNLNIFHAHPGRLPWYKGSTLFYYQYILEKKIYISIFKMSEKIDMGRIYMIKSYKKISLQKKDIIPTYRAKTFVNILKCKRKLSPKKNGPGEYYYIAHPLLRSFSLNSKLIRKSLNSMKKKL